jgi:hypothetical protein
VGAGLRYDTGSLSSAAGQSLTGNGYELGLSAKRLVGARDALSASLLAGAATYASQRTPGLPGSSLATGNESTNYVAAHLRAERSFDRASMTIEPYVDLGATRVNTGTFSELGAGVLDTSVAAHGETYTTLQSGVSFATLWRSAALSLQPALDFSITQFVGNAASSTWAQLAGAPAATAPFALRNAFGRTRFNLTPSLRIFEKNNLDLRLGGAYGFSNTEHAFSANVQLSKRL